MKWSGIGGVAVLMGGLVSSSVESDEVLLSSSVVLSIVSASCGSPRIGDCGAVSVVAARGRAMGWNGSCVWAVVVLVKGRPEGPQSAKMF